MTSPPSEPSIKEDNFLECVLPEYDITHLLYRTGQKERRRKKVPDWHVNQNLSLGFSVCLATLFKQIQMMQ
jgi:hypothetical protein